jgi:phage gp36-like protein
MDIARYYLYDARAPADREGPLQGVGAWLKDVANGAAVIVDAAAATHPEATDAAMSVQASDQVFTDDALALT